MRRMDCDQIRPQVGEVVVGGKTLQVMRRTIGQELKHDAEYKSVSKELKRLTEDGNGPGSDEYGQLLHAWWKREIEIFIPEFGEEQYQNIDHIQRVQILNIIFERDPEEMSEEDAKKNNLESEEAQPGEKS